MTVDLDVRLCDGEDLAAVRPDYNLDEVGHGPRRVRKAHARYLIDDGMHANDQAFRAPVTVRLRDSC